MAGRVTAGKVTLVGREEELQQIEAALAEPDLGGVVLSGPGGVGKTRLGEECLRIGEAAGIQTARVTATASAWGIPLGALTSLCSPPRLSSTRRALTAAAATSVPPPTRPAAATSSPPTAPARRRRPAHDR